MSEPKQAIFNGPQDPELLEWNTAELLDAQAMRYGEQVALVSLQQNTRLMYGHLRTAVRELSARLVDSGVCPGDRIAVLAGNSVEFVQVFFAATAVGAVAVLLPLISDAKELLQAIDTVEPKLVFIAGKIGYRSNIDALRQIALSLPGQVVIIGSNASTSTSASLPESCVQFASYLAGTGDSDERDMNTQLDLVWGKTPNSSPCCFQFTSGTTGARIVSMITSQSSYVAFPHVT